LLQRAQGVWVEDVDGNMFLDCNAGLQFARRAIAIRKWSGQIQDQAAELIHMCAADYYYRHMPQLAQKLDEIVPVRSPTRTHFANSGTEAIETALKLAMHVTGREKFIAFFNSFHGRTLGSLSLTLIESGAAARLQTSGAGCGSCALSKRIPKSVQRGRLRRRRRRSRRVELDREALFKLRRPRKK